MPQCIQLIFMQRMAKRTKQGHYYKNAWESSFELGPVATKQIEEKLQTL